MALPVVVLVSGCFDLLHSGHVEFFRQASLLGDELHVRLGTDANIRLLKHHDPMFPEQERLAMVRSVRYVHHAELSTGTGEFDFVADFSQVNPAVYVVNEDCSNLARRKEICQERGIRLVVKPRLPAPGLPERSSTAIKKHMRMTTTTEETTPPPWRLCLAGGWMDLDWCNALHAGCAITVNIHPHAGISRDQCGLATSSRKHFAALWPSGVPCTLPKEQAAVYLWGAENADHFALQSKPYVAGAQDHIGLLYPGINKLSFAGGSFWPHSVDSITKANVIAWLESVLYVVDIPFVSRPGADYNSQRINRLTDPQVDVEAKRDMVRALAGASDRAWAAILAMDSSALGGALSDTMSAWEAMLPYTVDPYLGEEGEEGDKSRALREFWKQYDAPHTKGCLFSGAGGGFLMVISDTPVAGGMKIRVNLGGDDN